MDDIERFRIQQSAMCDACDTGWRSKAECREMNPDIFDAATPGYDEVAAKKACGVCAVRACCLEFALAIPEQIPSSQIWGGLIGEERRGLAGS